MWGEPLNRYIQSEVHAKRRTEETVVLNAGRRAGLWSVVLSAAAVSRVGCYQTPY